MRIESGVTSISWIPSEAIPGVMRLPFEIGVMKYDDPPPDAVEDLEALRVADRFRFANELRAWVEVEDGRIVNYGQAGKGHVHVTTVRLGRGEAAFVALALPDLRPEPIVQSGTSVRFVQTAGGRTALPAPRPVPHPPFVQITPPLAWTTLALTINANGSSHHEVVGASPFPRHWIYDGSGRLAQKVGLMDFSAWYRDAFGHRTPWGGHDSVALVTEVETALERGLSRRIMRSGARPRIRHLAVGEILVEQGKPGNELFLLLDGVLLVDVDGEPVAEVGPGAILGERAILERGLRTATLRAVTPARVAVASRDQIADSELAELARSHQKEESSESDLV